MESQRDESVTHWLHQLTGSDDSAAQQQLWNRYFARLTALARTRLTGTPRREADEEDVVLSAFNSFFVAARAGRFPSLHDRTGLWPLLVTITARKAINQVNRQQAKKRSGSVDGELADVAHIVGNEPTPQFAAEVAEEVQRLLGQLDAELRTVAMMKLEGFTNVEIASHCGVVERSIARKLARIRLGWGEELGAADQD
jgi:DNA-directed RNA polymerase specialized sigma24 family protein